MEEALRAHLAANAGLSALVGSHIQWSVRDPEPAVVLYLIDAPPDWLLKGPSGLVQARVQIDSVAKTFLAAKAIDDALRAALPTIRQVLGGVLFLSCVVIDSDRDTLGADVNLLHRSRTDVRVSYRPA